MKTTLVAIGGVFGIGKVRAAEQTAKAEVGTQTLCEQEVERPGQGPAWETHSGLVDYINSKRAHVEKRMDEFCRVPVLESMNKDNAIIARSGPGKDSIIIDFNGSVPDYRGIDLDYTRESNITCCKTIPATLRPSEKNIKDIDAMLDSMVELIALQMHLCNNAEGRARPDLLVNVNIRKLKIEIVMNCSFKPKSRQNIYSI